jgi:hypothetical protein
MNLMSCKILILHIMNEKLTYISGLSAKCQLFIEAIEELKTKDINTYRSLFTVLTNEYVPGPVPNKFGWLTLLSDIKSFNLQKLRLFYFILFQYGFISCKYEEFEGHFIGNEYQKAKIRWQKKRVALVRLFVRLTQKKIIPDVGGLYNLLFDHFADKDGEDLKKNSFAPMVGRRIPKDVENIVDDIIAFLTC